MKLHPSVRVVPLGNECLVYGDHVGRGLRLPTDAWEQRHARPGILRRLEGLGLHVDTELGSLIPCPHRMTLWLPDEGALWAPLPHIHGPGGHAYQSIPLSQDESRLWAQFNGRRTLRDAVARAQLDDGAASEMVNQWTAFGAQLLQLRPSPPHPRDLSLSRLLGTPRAAHARPEGQYDPGGATTLGAYHLDDIHDGATHFDNRETTVAHALALPHPGLKHRPYGAALRAALGHEGSVIEVGCGTGELAAAWMRSGEVPYLRVDLSPELLRTQAIAAPHTGGVLADGLRLPVRDRSVPFLLSNEVLADLRSVPCDALDAQAQGFVERYGLRPQGWANVGAWALVEEVARVLSDDGEAMLTEFGTPDGAAEEAVQLDHPEVSIQFDTLCVVARSNGLHAEMIRLDELLDLDLRAPQLSRVSWMALRALAHQRGVHLQARAWTPETLALPWKVEGLQWTDLADEGPGPLVTRFYALRLRRRPTSAANPRSKPVTP